MLIQYLPPGGAAYRAINGHGWLEQHYILADLVDAQNQGTAATYRAAPGGKRTRSPKKYPRPGDERQHRIGDRAGRPTEDVVAYLDSLKPQTAA